MNTPFFTHIRTHTTAPILLARVTTTRCARRHYGIYCVLRPVSVRSPHYSSPHAHPPASILRQQPQTMWWRRRRRRRLGCIIATPVEAIAWRGQITVKCFLPKVNKVCNLFAGGHPNNLWHSSGCRKCTPGHTSCVCGCWTRNGTRYNGRFT